MRTAGRPLAVVCVLVLCLALPGAVAAKKKKKKKSPATTTVEVSKVVNAPIPDKAPAGGLDGLLASTIDVAGKQLKGREVRDVNVTLQTLGVTGTTPASDLQGQLIAPNGARTFLFNNLISGDPTTLSIGPLTLDDEALFQLGAGAPINSALLYSPWAGAATPSAPGLLFRYSLHLLDDGPVTGTWTLRIFDLATGEVSNLVSWKLNVTAGKPFQTK